MNVRDLDRSLADIRDGLAADGYHLTADLREDGGLRVSVTAEPEACDDCLVPKDVFRAIIGDAVGALATPDRIDVDYPEDATSNPPADLETSAGGAR